MRTPLLTAGLVLLLVAQAARLFGAGEPRSVGGSPVPSPKTAHTPGDVRKSIARALPFIETEGVGWMKERKCMSCHVVPFMVWSFNEAQAHGVKVDEKKLAEWTIWCVDDSFKHRDWFRLSEPNPKEKIEPYPDAIQAKIKPVLGKRFVTETALVAELGKILSEAEMKEHKALLVKRAALPPMGAINDGGSIESIAQMLLGQNVTWAPSAENVYQAEPKRDDRDRNLLIQLKEREAFKNLLLHLTAPDVILKWQEANGSWKAGGQLPAQNRPKAESTEVTTAWTLLALGGLVNSDPKVFRATEWRSVYEKIWEQQEGERRISKAIESGLAFFRQSKPGKSHESLLMHMLIEKRFGRPGEAEPFLKEVLARQNADGGWSWLSGGKSDAFATGQSLYALSIMGLSANAAPIQRAQKYLLETQSKEGVWEVPPQAISDTKAEGRLRRLVPIYHFWGSAWAVIGLSRSLGDN